MKQDEFVGFTKNNNIYLSLFERDLLTICSDNKTRKILFRFTSLFYHLRVELSISKADKTNHKRYNSTLHIKPVLCVHPMGNRLARVHVPTETAYRGLHTLFLSARLRVR